MSSSSFVLQKSSDPPKIKKNVVKPRVLTNNALLHSLAALAATLSAVAFGPVYKEGG